MTELLAAEQFATLIRLAGWLGIVLGLLIIAGACVFVAIEMRKRP